MYNAMGKVDHSRRYEEITRHVSKRRKCRGRCNYDVGGGEIMKQTENDGFNDTGRT